MNPQEIHSHTGLLSRIQFLKQETEQQETKIELMATTKLYDAHPLRIARNALRRTIWELEMNGFSTGLLRNTVRFLVSHISPNRTGIRAFLARLVLEQLIFKMLQPVRKHFIRNAIGQLGPVEKFPAKI